MVRVRTGLFLAAILAGLPAGARARAGAVSACPALVPAPTLFGKGAELHLSPSFGPIGTRVAVIGLGFHPRAHISIMYGPPNAEFVHRPIARAVAGARGRFVTFFTVTRAFAVRSPIQPLILEAFEGAQAGSGAYALTAFIVTV